MKVVEVSVDGGSGHQPLNQAWSLDTPTEGEGRRYQRRLRFELPTGGLAEELLLSEATELRLEAYPYAFDALSVHAPETATVERTVDHQGLLVTFPVARLIRSVRFRASAAALGKMTQVFRTDGDVIAEQPVASTLNAFPFMGLSASGTRVRSIAVEGPVTAARAASPAPRAGSVGAAETALFVAAVSAPTGGGELDVLDRRVVLRLAGGAGFSTLAVHDLEQVQLATEPENMRAGVCVPSLGAEVFFLPLTFNPGQPVQAGAALRGQLTTLLRRLQEKTAQDGIGGELPDPVTVELLLESDAPCRVVISQSGIDYLLARHSFPDGASKQVLRFPGGQTVSRAIGLVLPAAVTLVNASLSLSGNGLAAPAVKTGPTATGPLTDAADTPRNQGVRVDGSHAWASPVELVEAVLTAGWDLLLAGLVPGTQLALTVRADNHGQPGAEVLARAESGVPNPQGPQLQRFPLPRAILLNASRYWLSLEARAGAAVWYLQAAAHGQRVLGVHDRQSLGADGISGQIGIAFAVPDITAFGGRRVPEVSLGGQPLPLLQGEPDRLFDLGAVLPANPLPGEGLVGLDLDVTTDSERTVTVYPPRVLFDLPGGGP